MRAIVIATGCSPVWEALGASGVSPLLPIGDRPILQHIVERLVASGFRDFDLVLSESPEQVERHFADGQRWGCRIQYHLTSDFEKAASLVPSLARSEQPVLLALGDVLPLDPPSNLGGENARIYRVREDAPGHSILQNRWTGWAWIPASLAGSVPPRATWEDLGTWLDSLQQEGRAVSVEGKPGLSSRTGTAYLESQTRALTEMAEELHFSAFPAGPGVWIGRNVSLPSTVQIEAPVLIGENSQIGQAVKLGPGAVICAGCLVDDQSHIAESVVLPGSYVGRFLDVEHSVIHHHRLINVKLDAAVSVADAFMLGHVEGGGGNESYSGLIANLLARIFSLAVVPFVLLLILLRALTGQKPLIHHRTFVKAGSQAGAPPETADVWSFLPPAEAAKADGWRHFFMVFMPGLVAVLLGNLRLVGVTPRDMTQLRDLPQDWRELCQQSKPGLLTESFVQSGPDATEDELYASEAFCAVASDWRFSCKVAVRYLMLLALGRPDSAELGSTGKL